MPSNRLLTRTLDTPLRALVAAAVVDEDGDERLCMLEFHRSSLERGRLELEAAFDHDWPTQDTPRGVSHVLDQTEQELARYLAGELREFTVPLTMPGTPWQQSVWRQLLAIPYGQTRSYGDLAEALGRPGAQRAVGAANGQNRIAIIVPCHRVLASTGALHGYGGGIETKRRLLEIEGALAPEPALFSTNAANPPESGQLASG